MKFSIKFLSKLGFQSGRGGIVIAELALVGLMLLTVYAVLARYVFRSPSIHALEVSQYLLLVISWMSIGWVLIVGRHVRMEALYNVLPRTLKLSANLISKLAIILFSGVLIWAGSVNVMTALEKGYRSSSLLSFPMWVPYLLIPLGGILLLLAALSISPKETE
ncbi:TRAP transporter small permease [Vreelandella lionensis]|jgi:TRAP-type C4-dicarboxylate transport system permease small subunit|uniref:TRAP transporter small permease protein n=1 Tax=Vreelandella lionensis TaxID=1144478 RepID=A0ABW8BUV5_9GAMM|tara:strand:- start:69 stop:557 length:489 start_codon:yes stop_codon:yes gene_type:complete